MLFTEFSTSDPPYNFFNLFMVLLYFFSLVRSFFICFFDFADSAPNFFLSTAYTKLAVITLAAALVFLIDKKSITLLSIKFQQRLKGENNHRKHKSPQHRTKNTYNSSKQSTGIQVSKSNS